MGTFLRREWQDEEVAERHPLGNCLVGQRSLHRKAILKGLRVSVTKALRSWRYRCWALEPGIGAAWVRWWSLQWGPPCVTVEATLPTQF